MHIFSIDPCGCGFHPAPIGLYSTTKPVQFNDLAREPDQWVTSRMLVYLPSASLFGYYTDGCLNLEGAFFFQGGEGWCYILRYGRNSPIRQLGRVNVTAVLENVLIGRVECTKR